MPAGLASRDDDVYVVGLERVAHIAVRIGVDGFVELSGAQKLAQGKRRVFKEILL